MNKRLIAAATALCLIAAPALAADKVKIGFVTTLSGPQGVIGKHQKDAADLSLEMLGGKIGGIPAEIVYGDDQFKPDVGREVAEEMLKKDKVDFMTGFIWSNVLLAAYQPIIKSGTILISANAGPHEIAGAMCAPNFFSTSWQNDETPEAMGQYMTDRKMTDVYIMAPDYAAGKDMLAGFKRYFKGKLVDEVYTKMGQADYQAEISQIRAANPKAVMVFYPGGMGIQFIKQYAQSGLRERNSALFGVTRSTRPCCPPSATRPTAITRRASGAPDLKNPRNQQFVAAFRKKYGYFPSFYAAESFDAISLIDSAVKAVKGDLADKKGLLAAFDKADFASVRGPYTYNTNHFPIENFYLFKIAKDAEGNHVRKLESTVFTNHKDAYYEECKMQ